MKILYNNIIPLKGFQALNLFGVILARKQYGELSETTINHEAIHTAQMKELLYIPFYIIYGIEYIINLIKYKDGHKAYKNISFEREAYGNERDLEYLKGRRIFNQWRKLV